MYLGHFSVSLAVKDIRREALSLSSEALEAVVPKGAEERAHSGGHPSSWSSSSKESRQVAATWASFTTCFAASVVRSHGSSLPLSMVTREILRRHAWASGWQSVQVNDRASNIFAPSAFRAVSVAMESVRRNTSS